MNEGLVPPPQSRSPVRIEGNYLQTAMQLWTNINIVIWQRLAAVLLVQVGGLAFSVQSHGSIAAILAMVLVYGLSLFLLFAIYSDQKVRTELIRQANFIASRAMSDFYSDNATELERLRISAPFQLYDLEYDTRHKWIRDIGGAVVLLVCLTVIDVYTILFFGIQIDTSISVLGLPLTR